MIKLDDRTAFLVKLESTCLLIYTIDAAHIDEHIDELTTDLVVLHLNWVTVGRDVDLADHVEEESLLYLA